MGKLYSPNLKRKVELHPYRSRGILLVFCVVRAHSAGLGQDARARLRAVRTVCRGSPAHRLGCSACPGMLQMGGIPTGFRVYTPPMGQTGITLPARYGRM